jgi:hypothetical protein
MLLKTPWSFEPTSVTALMITTEISAAMRPYSIAVAPLSSRSNRLSNIVMIRLRYAMRFGAQARPGRRFVQQESRMIYHKCAPDGAGGRGSP